MQSRAEIRKRLATWKAGVARIDAATDSGAASAPSLDATGMATVVRMLYESLAFDLETVYPEGSQRDLWQRAYRALIPQQRDRDEQ